jgi:hypothetical protein
MDLQHHRARAEGPPGIPRFTTEIHQAGAPRMPLVDVSSQHIVKTLTR